MELNSHEDIPKRESKKKKKNRFFDRDYCVPLRQSLHWYRSFYILFLFRAHLLLGYVGGMPAFLCDLWFTFVYSSLRVMFNACRVETDTSEWTTPSLPAEMRLLCKLSRNFSLSGTCFVITVSIVYEVLRYRPMSWPDCYLHSGRSKVCAIDPLRQIQADKKKEKWKIIW